MSAITASPLPAEHLAHIAPITFKHINMQGKMRFAVAERELLWRNNTEKNRKSS
jgi:hypothetical protein